MSRSNGSPILVAEVNRFQAKRLVRALKALSCTVRVADSAEKVLKLLRTEVFHEGLIAVELQIGKDSVLAYLSRLLAVRYLVGVGSADDPDAEMRARLDGAQVYLPRPVTSEMLCGLPWIRNNRERLAGCSAGVSDQASALAGAGWSLSGFSCSADNRYSLSKCMTQDKQASLLSFSLGCEPASDIAAVTARGKQRVPRCGNPEDRF